MKATSGAVFDEVRQSHVNQVTPLLTAEWNQNRYYTTLVDNTPTEDSSGYDIELFPIESITKPNRPTSGIVKAVVGQALVAQNYYDAVPSQRYYTCSVDDIYKYWQSPEVAAATTPFNINNCAPQVLYYQEDGTTPRTIKANKISFTIENSYAVPDAYTVQVKTTTGGAWTTVATNPTIPTNGRVQFWYNGTSWTTTKNLSNVTDVHAVRLVVTSMDKTAYFNLIELGFRLELDLTADLINTSDNFNLGEQDFITPLGTISSNSGTVTLQNEIGTYSNDNAASVLFGLLDKNVEFTLKYHYAGGDIQQFKLCADDWEESIDETSVTLYDQSQYLMEVKPQASLYQNISVQEAVWRLCDSVGFNNYQVTAISTEANSIIDIFWTDGVQSLWEVFQELSRGTQTAIYFDGNGVLQVKTREAAFNSAASPVWALRENTSGVELPDIIEVTESDTYEANKVTVKYQPTGFSEMVGNIIPFEVVWEPEGVVTLRSSDLTKDLLIGGTDIVLTNKHASVWPWKGICQIEGEWIRYEGKRYSYYDGTTRMSAWVKSLAEQKKLDAKSSPAKVHLNTYTGALQATERGLWNTEEVDHRVEPFGYTTRRISNYSGSGATPAKGFELNRSQSTVTLKNNKNQKMNDYFYVHRGNAVDQGWLRLGTRMKIDKTGHKDKCAGIFFNGDSIGAGYYVEIMATSEMDAKMRSTRNELVFYSQKTDGSKKQFGGEHIVSKDKSKNHEKGTKKALDIGDQQAVVQNRWVEIDVYYSPGTDDQIQIWFNGRLAFTATVPNASGWKHSNVSRFGMYVRGHSQATFDYLYGISRPDILYGDEEIFQDRIDGGYRGNQMDRDYVYETRTVRRKVKKKWTKVKQRYSQRFYDEFGPMVHEVREFDIKFDTDGLPVLQSKLFHSNETQAVCTEFTGDVAGAYFIMANTSRDHAILNGDDNLTAKGEGSINQKLFVYGRPVIQKDEAQVVKTDDWAIRRRGEIETEYASKWVQNKDAAESLATWLTTHWTRSDSALEVEVFGNPLFELSDVVSIQYQDMTTATHKYYVVGINTSFDRGITTNLTLRRVT